MSKKKEKEFQQEEEPQMAPLDDLGADVTLDTEEKEAIEAIKKFTDEDSDEHGEISVKSILGGDFLMSKFMIKQIMFVMFCVLLMILYTGNRYDSQQDTILIDSLRGRLQEVKYNVLTQSSELMNLTRQSNVEKALHSTPDSLLHNSITPPFLIKAGTTDPNVANQGVEEVLVDAPEPSAEESEPQPEQAETGETPDGQTPQPDGEKTENTETTKTPEQ